jgi:hypothetical protein
LHAALPGLVPLRLSILGHGVSSDGTGNPPLSDRLHKSQNSRDDPRFAKRKQ